MSGDLGMRGDGHGTIGVMADLPRSAAARTARLAALPMGYAGRKALGLGKRLGGKPAEAVLTEVQMRTAEQLFRTLGQLKGGAMKLGQALSVFEAAMPADLVAPYRDQLVRLQDSAPPMPVETVREILAAELGDGWEQRLTLDPEPAAAASIGQVHRGRWEDGREVAVKVQYPGAGDALRSDLRQLALASRVLTPLFPGLDMKQFIAELRARTQEELDYGLEAQAQRAFAAGYADDPDIEIPDVVVGGATVLVTEWLPSASSLATVISSGSQVERDHYGELFARFLLSGPSRVGLLHADPHPGNFRIIPAADGGPGRLGVLDFGAAARLPDGLPRPLGVILRACLAGDSTVLMAVLRREGFVRDGVRLDPETLTAYLAPFVTAAGVERFHFTRAWLQEQSARVTNPRDPGFSIATRLNLPPDYLLVHRTLAGAAGILSQLEAEVPFRGILEELLPGFAGA